MVANDVMNLRRELSLVRFVGFSIIDSQRRFHLYTQFCNGVCQGCLKALGAGELNRSCLVMKLKNPMLPKTGSLQLEACSPMKI